MRIKFLIGCASVGLVLASGLATAEEDTAALLADTRKQALPVLPKVMNMMQTEVAKVGPAEAIPVCKEKAVVAVQERAKETGWTFSRVSLKTRNPDRGRPDVWEAKHLADFDVRAANGEKPEQLEVGEVVTDAQGKRTFRYLRAIPVGAVCLNCHGSADKIDEGVKAKLGVEYPHDKATGYSLGQIRGALSVKRPL